MKTLKLLPCPHCGSEAKLELFDPPPQAIWSVSCKNDCSFDLCGGRAKAIAAWNRRAGQSHDAGLLAALAGPMAWLDGWAQHVGNCQGGYFCTCGLVAARSELSAAIAAAKGTPHD